MGAGRRLFSTADSANPGAFTAADWALFCSISTIWGASFLLPRVIKKPVVRNNHGITHDGLAPAR